jgi:hypothetical protein
MFKREAIAMMIYLLGPPVVGLFVAIATPQIVKLLGAPHSRAPVHDAEPLPSGHSGSLAIFRAEPT